MKATDSLINSIKSIKFPISLASLTGILVCLGFIKGYIFYYVFGIDIRHFFSATDMIKFVSSDLLLLGLSSLALFINLFMNAYVYNEEKDENENENDKTKVTVNKTTIFLNKITPKTANQKTIFRLVLMVLLAISVTLSIKCINTFENLFIIIILLIGLFIVIVTSTLNFNNDRFFHFKVLITIITLYTFFQIGITEIKKVKKGKYNGTYVKTKEKEYISTDSLLFINKSDDYTFFYNTKFKYTEVIPNSEILLFRIKTNDVKINE